MSIICSNQRIVNIFQFKKIYNLYKNIYEYLCQRIHF